MVHFLSAEAFVARQWIQASAVLTWKKILSAFIIHKAQVTRASTGCPDSCTPLAFLWGFRKQQIKTSACWGFICFYSY